MDSWADLTVCEAGARNSIPYLWGLQDVWDLPGHLTVERLRQTPQTWCRVEVPGGPPGRRSGPNSQGHQKTLPKSARLFADDKGHRGHTCHQPMTSLVRESAGSPGPFRLAPYHSFCGAHPPGKFRVISAEGALSPQVSRTALPDPQRARRRPVPPGDGPRGDTAVTPHGVDPLTSCPVVCPARAAKCPKASVFPPISCTPLMTPNGSKPRGQSLCRGRSHLCLGRYGNHTCESDEDPSPPFSWNFAMKTGFSRTELLASFGRADEPQDALRVTALRLDSWDSVRRRAWGTVEGEGGMGSG